MSAILGSIEEQQKKRMEEHVDTHIGPKLGIIDTLLEREAEKAAEVWMHSEHAEDENDENEKQMYIEMFQERFLEKLRNNLGV